MPPVFANNWTLVPLCGLRTDNPSTASVVYMTHVNIEEKGKSKRMPLTTELILSGLKILKFRISK